MVLLRRETVRPLCGPELLQKHRFQTVQDIHFAPLLHLTRCRKRIGEEDAEWRLTKAIKAELSQHFCDHAQGVAQRCVGQSFRLTTAGESACHDRAVVIQLWPP